MNNRSSLSKSNNTPWMDTLTLISVISQKDDQGFETPTESSRTIDCNFYDGVSRGEFYESLKAGKKASATVEIWPEDYQKEDIADYNGTKYSVLRHYPSGYGTIFLILEEVVH